MSTDIKETYQGLVDGAEVVFAYKAFAEPDQPYCISVNLGGDKYLAATLQPTLPDEFISAAEADGLNREQIVRWVNVLTEMFEKAQAWDDFNADLAQIATDDQQDYVLWSPDSAVSVVVGGDNPTVDKLLSPYQVDRLGYDETDEIWEDIEGDFYQFRDGEWRFSGDLNDPFEAWVSIIGSEDFLTDYGPYTAVVRPRRAVQVLTAAERDAEWEFINNAGERFVYRWTGDDWHCSLNGDRFTSVGADGPQLEGIGLLMEIV
ncbi:hypothetical protein PBI_MRMAGOO_57 [Mycobacterium phage MrMagoo]|uniref:Uncharacterized protein n=1 Tax=Mycobacterium phage MrMagoo TaxID=1927020 RepID=A0A1L6BYJ9_9CAUD|nr:hypothetical protein J4U04_gp057 [Mycobacterium phage MrMagoo]APQ42161.1 hypothetical protein PBI_MRMAGOO_57 [Mycobacterium phage MrMagoo]ARM70237.1 hypothetical protein SEA_GARDENSALSA_57 [Mycobacterium phage GardenSalsa]